MSKQQPQSGLVPRLRFPEFREAGEWELQTLRSVCQRIMDGTHFSPKTKSGPRPYLTSKNVRDGWIDLSTVSYISEEEHRQIYARCPVQKLDVLLTKDGANTGNCAINTLDFEFSLLSSVAVLRGDASLLDQHFLYQSIASESLQATIMNSMSGQAITRITLEKLGNYAIVFPDITEQQRIADCLSSLDTLIAAQADKLDALKTHKKGLMQQLFLREGETIPRLRFPEFREAGEWIEETLEQVAEYENGKAHEQDIDDQGRYVVVNSKFISTEGEVTKFSNAANLLAKKDDILMVLSDVPNGRAIAKCFFVDKGNTYTVNQRICKLTAQKNVVSLMLFYILDRNAYFLAFDDGVKQTNLKKDDVLRCPVLLPDDKAEQQKIADCLSSLDALIAAQANKLDALKTHKKGLMQQLFPSPEA